MMRLAATGIWICLVTIVSAYVSGVLTLRQPDAADKHAQAAGDERKTTAPISVPIIAGGGVEGYVTAQFVYIVDAKAMKKIAIAPDAFVTGEAFRILYSEPLDFNHIEKYDLAGLTNRLAKNVNERLGEDIIKNVLVVEFNYVAKSEISQ